MLIGLKNRMVVKVEEWEQEELKALLNMWGASGYSWNSGQPLETKTPLLSATLFLELEEDKVSYWYSYDRAKNSIKIKQILGRI